MPLGLHYLQSGDPITDARQHGPNGAQVRAAPPSLAVAGQDDHGFSRSLPALPLPVTAGIMLASGSMQPVLHHGMFALAEGVLSNSLMAAARLPAMQTAHFRLMGDNTSMLRIRMQAARRHI